MNLLILLFLLARKEGMHNVLNIFGDCLTSLLLVFLFGGWGIFFGEFPPKTISFIFTYRGPLSKTPIVSIGLSYNMAGLFLGM